MMHNGVDLQARYENVYSIFPGHVLKWVNRSEYYVKVQTIDYTISFCHLSKIYAFRHHKISFNKSPNLYILTLCYDTLLKLNNIKIM